MSSIFNILSHKFNFIKTITCNFLVPSTFQSLFMDGTGAKALPTFGASLWTGGLLEAGLGAVVVGNYLCIRELLNLLAANGEQEECVNY